MNGCHTDKLISGNWTRTGTTGEAEAKNNHIMNALRGIGAHTEQNAEM